MNDHLDNAWTPVPRSCARRALRTPTIARRLFLALAVLCVGDPALAQVQRSFLNPGFEAPMLVPPAGATACYKIISESLVPGWTTTHPSGAPTGDCASPTGTSGPLMELWLTGFGGVPARAGANFAELNASASSRLYQNVCLINGETIQWRFSHRGRGSTTLPDVMDYNVGASSPIVRVSTTSSGAVPAGTPVATQGTVNAPGNGGNGWRDYAGSFAYGGPTGVTSMGFESISTGSGSNTVGNFLDNIEIELRPFLEFVQTATATPENATSNVPTLRVDGTAMTTFTVTIAITGGTATLGTDYTTPGNASTVTVTIPAGIYDGASAASLFPLPITVTQDLLAEANETIALQIQPPGGAMPPFLLNSAMTCGGAGNASWLYTIVDDDSGLVVTKSAAAPVPVAGQPGVFDTAYTVVVENTAPAVSANYSLVDAPGFDVDASIVSASVQVNGAPAVPLAGTGPWTLQPQWRALAAGASDRYVVSVRTSIARGGTTANDTCAAPTVSGSGLHNAATATVQAAAGTNPAFTASACRNTPTPAWVTLTKSLPARASAADQFQVRTLAAGNPAASATTTGTATSATTGALVVMAGTTLQFDEALAGGGVPGAYASTIACTNAAAGSATPLPAGTGTDSAGRRQWPVFTAAAGDDIACVITNTPIAADLAIAKTNNSTGPLVAGMQTTYVLTVTNNGPSAVTGAVVRDAPGPGLGCAPASPVTCSPAASCPAGTTVASLTGSAGVALGTLANGASVTLTFACTVQ